MRKISVYIWVSALLCLCSCNDWLDVKPAEEIGVEDMFSSEAGFKDALTACYIKLYSDNLYGERLVLTDVEFLAQHWELNSQNEQSREKIKDFNYQEETVEASFQSIYSEMYNAIAQANAVLDKFTEYGGAFRSDHTRKLIEGELLAIRAFCHLDILRLFGQLPQNGTKQVSLPYVEEVTINPLQSYSFEEFTERILRDIHAAEELMKDSDPLLQYTYAQLDDLKDVVPVEDDFFLFRRFRFNYYALKAMEARLYMYLGDTDKALETAVEVIGAKTEQGEALLQLGGADDFSAKNYALPSECLLALNKADMDGILDNTLYLLPDTYEKTLFAGQSVGTNNRTSWWKKERKDNEDRMYLQKYKQPDVDENVGEGILMTQKQVIPLIRLSEMYLIAIESALTLEQANEFYGKYMRAREVMITGSLSERELKTELEREYRREFWGEGQMFYWYKRHSARRMLWKADRELSENDYIVPLPKTEVKTN